MEIPIMAFQIFVTFSLFFIYPFRKFDPSTLAFSGLNVQNFGGPS